MGFLANPVMWQALMSAIGMFDQQDLDKKASDADMANFEEARGLLEGFRDRNVGQQQAVSQAMMPGYGEIFKRSGLDAQRARDEWQQMMWGGQMAPQQYDPSTMLNIVEQIPGMPNMEAAQNVREFKKAKKSGRRFTGSDVSRFGTRGERKAIEHPQARPPMPRMPAQQQTQQAQPQGIADRFSGSLSKGLLGGNGGRFF